MRIYNMKIYGNGEMLSTLIPGLSAPCAGQGRCGKCRVRAWGELSELTEAEKRVLSAEEIANGWRLACQTKALGEVTVEYEKDTGEVQLDAREKQLAVDAGMEGKGFAIDVGTTTVAVYEVDLATGKILSTHSAMNPQRRFGADVISRIKSSLEGSDLTTPIRESLGEIAKDASAWTVVGNPAMMQLLCGLSVEGISRAPFTPAYTEAICKNGAYVAPLISGFVGADAVAAGIYADMDMPGGTRLLLDVGTNGEMLLSHNGKIGACAAAAGPAFEGAHIEYGMGGTEGAIRKARLLEDGTWELETIGNTAPRGICGSGLIDIAAELVRAEIIDETGRMDEDVLIADGVYLTRKDVREIQLAKAAIAAGIELLAKEMGAKQIETVYLAGGFGSHIDPESALAIGLLPASICKNIVPIGNAAGMGAVEMLLSSSARERAEALARETQYIELSEMKEFQDSFVENMLFE
ncbi:MAG: DUF4445 domain-containing protein [Clostridiales bacterium]|nr:DUF4445 domain-containing protein [Clostridiales bacterium]